jgi:uncharacterized membrane protein/3-hydroxymyristoyl/3-hydroxydecanoyl-(acyl carrier protein) dehydratase
MSWKKVPVLLAVTYPILTHTAIASGSATLTVASVILLTALVLAPGLMRRSWIAWLAIPPVAGSILLLLHFDLPSLPLYGPPVLITGFMAWLFGHTLAHGRTPLIEQFARLMRAPDQPLEAAIVAHARRVTIVWTVLLITLCALNLVLAMVAVPAGLLVSMGIHPPFQVTQTVWSLFANVLNYVFLVALFVGEYAYRRFRFPNLPYSGMVDFLRRAAAIRPWDMIEERRLSDRMVSATAPSYETSFTIAPAHPAMAGHFPGSPIVPGVLMLDTVLTRAEIWLGRPLHPTGMPMVKFLAPLLPDEEAVAALRLTTAGLTFTISRSDTLIAQGVFSLAPADTS